MHQLNIEYFFPLTEQIPLDLDYTPCKEYESAKQRLWVSGSTGQLLVAGTGLTGASWGNIEPLPYKFKPAPDDVGYWEIRKDMQVWRKQKPNWLHRNMSNIFFGFKWNDK